MTPIVGKTYRFTHCKQEIECTGTRKKKGDKDTTYVFWYPVKKRELEMGMEQFNHLVKFDSIRQV